MVQDAQVARATLVQTKYTDELMSKPHVVGVGVGMTKSGVGLVVMVDEMPPADSPPQDRIPTELDGVPVEVQEVGTIRAQ